MQPRGCSTPCRKEWLSHTTLLPTLPNCTETQRHRQPGSSGREVTGLLSTIASSLWAISSTFSAPIAKLNTVRCLWLLICLQILVSWLGGSRRLVKSRLVISNFVVNAQYFTSGFYVSACWHRHNLLSSSPALNARSIRARTPNAIALRHDHVRCRPVHTGFWFIFKCVFILGEDKQYLKLHGIRSTQQIENNNWLSNDNYISRLSFLMGL